MRHLIDQQAACVPLRPTQTWGPPGPRRGPPPPAGGGGGGGGRPGLGIGAKRPPPLIPPRKGEGVDCSASASARCGLSSGGGVHWAGGSFRWAAFYSAASASLGPGAAFAPSPNFWKLARNRPGRWLAGRS